MTDLPIQLPAPAAGGRYWVAFSGGLDSTVLLHFLALSTELPVAAVHIDHGLQQGSADWARHCHRFAETLGVAIETIKIKVVDADDIGPEAAARSARYSAIEKLLQPHDILLTAHHQDDQAETLLLQLLRGSGPHGLASMPAQSALGQGRHLRPLLNVSRAEIKAYAETHKLNWIDDPSNENEHFRRNFLRHSVLPVIEQCWPQYSDCLSRSASLQAEAATLLDDLAGLDLENCSGGAVGSLSIGSLLQLSVERRRNVIRFWIRGMGMSVPNHAHMQRIEEDVLGAREDANPVVAWAGSELHRYRDDLLVMARLPAIPEDESLIWDIREPIDLPAGCGRLEAECAQGAGLRLETPRLELRFNQSGERIQTVFSKHHKRLKHLFQENAVPPWVRERLPLIYHGQNLAAVADCWIAADYAARQDEQGWLIHWRDAPVGWLAPESLLEP